MPSFLAADAGTFVTEGFASWAPWLVLFTPLFVAVLITCLPALRKNNSLAGLLAIGGVALGFCITFFYYFVPHLTGGAAAGDVYEYIVNWIVVGDDLKITFGTRLDALSLNMTLVVTGVGLAIFVYARGYMHGDPSEGRFFAKFSLFVFSMLGIVLSPNFFQTFIFWELVGASSYLLIGYYWKKHSAGEAAKKAFLTNRVGDFGFLLGILMVWAAVGGLLDVTDAARVAELGADKVAALAPAISKYGAFDFSVIGSAVQSWEPTVLFDGAVWAAIAAALVFCGAMGKSAQFPLHVWLPDAMEGPTPVSALMHAATMVAAGIYMIIRCYFLFDNVSWAPTLLAWLGGITAFIAATMAITQRDIKKVLAYSTLSQLGYMAMALGAGSYTAAMFHLTTHAFFKALLFLCAGSVIHGCHHEQDMFQMGGLRTKMKSTHLTWAIGTLALCGIFPLAGFWSKDEILGAVQNSNQVWGAMPLWGLGTLVAGMTAFYMGRAWILTFFRDYRGHADVHESPKVMTVPLWVLAIFSVFIGFVGIPGQNNRFEHFLHAWHVGGPAEFHMSVALISTVVALAGLALAYVVYYRAPSLEDDPLKTKLGPLWTLWDRLYYIDTFYLWLVKSVQQGIAKVCWWFERWVVIQALVNGTAQLFRVGGDSLRRAQTGRLNGYVTSFVLGAAVVLCLVLIQVVTH